MFGMDATVIPPSELELAVDFLEKAKNHADTQEWRIRMSGLQAEVLARGAASVKMWSSLRHGGLGHLDKIRTRLHDEIVERLIVSGSVCSGTPIAVLMMGLPGAGKTSIGKRYVQRSFGLDFTTINPDDAKEALPEYEGWNASALHHESSHIAEDMLQQCAIRRRCNLIFDMTGTGMGKIENLVSEKLNEAGYRIYSLLIDVPPIEAVKRVWHRFQENPFRRNSVTLMGSRYVPLEHVYYKVGTKPIETFERTHALEGIVGHCRLNALNCVGDEIEVKEDYQWPKIKLASI